MISNYCKDYLPTWDELYNEFYIKKMFHYNPDDQLIDQTNDLYWKISRRKLLLAFSCNQLNKMIMENNINDIRSILGGIEIDNLRFVLLTQELKENISMLIEENTQIPKMYVCKIPSTNQYSIFLNKNHQIIDIDTLNSNIELKAIISTDISVSISSSNDLSLLIEFLLKDVIKYFKNGISWK